MRLDIQQALRMKLPCGCKMVGNVKFLGIDGSPIEHVLRFDTVTGEITVFAATLDPSLIVDKARPTVDARGREVPVRVLTKAGMRPVDCVAPFELVCKVHGPQNLDLGRPVDAFHAHLDTCTQCRERPFELCSVGASLLKTAAAP